MNRNCAVISHDGEWLYEGGLEECEKFFADNDQCSLVAILGSKGGEEFDDTLAEMSAMLTYVKDRKR